MNKFLQTKGYHKEGDAADKITIYSDDLLDKNKTYNILAIDASTKMKERYESINDLLVSMIGNLSVSRANYEDVVTSEGIDLRMIDVVKGMGRFLGYLQNCTSWNVQSMQEYDKIELLNRLEKIKFALKNS